MAPSTQRNDTTAELEMPTAEVLAAGAGDLREEQGRRPWHDRPVVLAAASLVGVVALAALVVSVVDVSDESLQPANGPVPTVSVDTPAPAAPSTIDAPPTGSTESVPSPAASAPNFAAGPTAETLVPPAVSTPAPAPFELPRWLRRLLRQDDGPADR